MYRDVMKNYSGRPCWWSYGISMQSWLCVPSVVRSVSRSVLRMCSDVRSDVCVFLRLRRQVGHQEVPFLPPRPLFTLQTRRRPSGPCQHTRQIHPRCRRKPTPAAYEGTSPPIPILHCLEKRQISPYPGRSIPLTSLRPHAGRPRGRSVFHPPSHYTPHKSSGRSHKLRRPCRYSDMSIHGTDCCLQPHSPSIETIFNIDTWTCGFSHRLSTRWCFLFNGIGYIQQSASNSK